MAVTAAAFAMGVAMAAHGEPPAGADSDSVVGQWFKSLKVPGSTASCCDVSDCRPTDYRMGQEGYEVPWNNEWLKIPNQLVIKNKPNLVGRGVWCRGGEGEPLNSPPFTRCFVPASET